MTQTWLNDKHFNNTIYIYYGNSKEQIIYECNQLINKYKKMKPLIINSRVPYAIALS